MAEDWVCRQSPSCGDGGCEGGTPRPLSLKNRGLRQLWGAGHFPGAERMLNPIFLFFSVTKLKSQSGETFTAAAPGLSLKSPEIMNITYSLFQAQILRSWESADPCFSCCCYSARIALKLFLLQAPDYCNYRYVLPHPV